MPNRSRTSPKGGAALARKLVLPKPSMPPPGMGSVRKRKWRRTPDEKNDAESFGEGSERRRNRSCAKNRSDRTVHAAEDGPDPKTKVALGEVVRIMIFRSGHTLLKMIFILKIDFN